MPCYSGVTKGSISGRLLVLHQYKPDAGVVDQLVTERKQRPPRDTKDSPDALPLQNVDKGLGRAHSLSAGFHKCTHTPDPLLIGGSRTIE